MLKYEIPSFNSGERRIESFKLDALLNSVCVLHNKSESCDERDQSCYMDLTSIVVVVLFFSLLHSLKNFGGGSHIIAKDGGRSLLLLPDLAS